MTSKELFTITLEIPVNYGLSSQFIKKIADCDHTKINNVYELVKNELLIYKIECPDHLQDHIMELGFMTFINNRQFQKYYGN